MFEIGRILREMSPTVDRHFKTKRAEPSSDADTVNGYMDTGVLTGDNPCGRRLTNACHGGGVAELLGRLVDLKRTIGTCELWWEGGTPWGGRDLTRWRQVKIQGSESRMAEEATSMP